jgi:hypothetical protein
MTIDGRKAVIELIVSRNTEILKLGIASGHFTPTLFWLLDPKTFQPVPPQNGKWSRLRKTDDIIAAAMVGCVVLDAKHGADAVRVKDGMIEYVELKLAIVECSNYWVNKNGTIYTGYGDTSPSGNLNATGLQSNISGSFSHIGDAEDKRRPTILVVMEDSENPLVGAWEISGDQVVVCLTTNRVKKTEAKRNKGEIKLSTFLSLGKDTPTVIESSGLESLKLKIRNQAQKSPFERNEPEPAGRKKGKKSEKVVDSVNLLA